MSKIVLIFLFAFQFCSSSSQDIGWWNVDCGSDVPHKGPNSIIWATDEGFIKTGTNKRLPQRQLLEEMNTVRSFPNTTDQSCYKLPTYPQTLRYLIRAGFYYGDYDGYSKPPAFDLYIDNKKWSTVNTSGPIYVEALHVTHGSGSVSVCLMEIENGGVPFISSLEAVPLWVILYPQMETHVTFALVDRINFGGNEVRLSSAFSEEKYNRIWTQSATPINCHEVPTLPDSTAIPENDPPISVLHDSIESLGIFFPINLIVDLPPTKTEQTVYIVLYFAETYRPVSKDRRIIGIYINGAYHSQVETEVKKCKVVTLYPIVINGSTIHIDLARATYSTLPPIISAIEVFRRIDAAPTENNSNSHCILSVYLVLIQVLLVTFRVFI